MRKDAFTLSDLREPTLTIVCQPCGRRGRYSVARLIAKHGDAKILFLLSTLANCPKTQSTNIYDRSQSTLRRALNSLALFAARSLPLHLICRLVLPQPNINRVSQGYATIAPHSRSTISAHTFRIEVREMRMPTMEHRKGKLTGHQAADCTVTISKMDGVESSRTITDVSPHVLDGDYKLAVAGESSTSRWRRDKNGWSVLA
jgi:hypothetical protein